MGKKEKEGRVKKSGVLFVEADLVRETIPGVVEGVDFIAPKRFSVKRIEPQSKTDQQAQGEYGDLSSFAFV